MTLKSYFAETVQDAIEQARTELGPDAMLLNSRKNVSEHAHLGAFEVVFGMTGEPVRQHKPSPPPKPAKSRKARSSKATNPNVAAPQGSQISKGSHPIQVADELSELRKQIEVVSASLSGINVNAGDGKPRESQGLEQIYSRLTAFDFSDSMSRELVAAVERVSLPDFESTLKLMAGGDPAGADYSRRALMAELESRFDVRPEVGKPGARRQAVMFVGPPGVGKTTTVVKLAIKLGLQQRLPVHLLSLDTVRVGGSDQLESFARILGVSFKALHTIDDLNQALKRCRTRSLVLIDSPGYAPADMAEAEETAAYLNEHPEIEIQLVLPASLRPTAFAKFWERFEVFKPTKLLFTHLDEVDTLGPLLEYSMRSRLPISFLTDGQSIPQDLHPATKGRLFDGLFASSKSAAFSA